MAWKRAAACDNSSGNCVEVDTDLGGAVGVRDSKFPGGEALVYTKDEWAAFVAAVKDGQFDVR